MALFGSGRDASLIRSINRELIHNILSIEVELYKLSLDDTPINIYNESNLKTYYNPVKMCCLLNKQPTTAENGEFGIDFSRTAEFGFLRDDLKDINFVLETGDIISWDNNYFEIDNVRGSQYWIGRNEETLPAVISNEIDEYGYSVSIICETHQVRISSLQLNDTNYGVPKTQTQTKTFKNY